MSGVYVEIDAEGSGIEIRRPWQASKSIELRFGYPGGCTIRLGNSDLQDLIVQAASYLDPVDFAHALRSELYGEIGLQIISRQLIARQPWDPDYDSLWVDCD